MFKNKPTVRGSTEMPEVVLNLWYFVDESGGFIYRLTGRAYAMTGPDEQKLATLHKLSATDFHIAPIMSVPKRFQIVSESGTLEGVTDPAMAAQDPAELFREVIDTLESSLPTQMCSIGEQPQTYRLKIPENPLMVCTCVIEREDGTLEPRLAKDST